MKRISVVLMVVVGLAFGCVSDETSGPEDQDRCEVLSTSISDCGGSVPDEFDGYCDEDPEGADQLTAALCSSDSEDSIFGWKGDGERCFNFNFECASGLSCIPRDQWEEDHFCGAPRANGRCDDDGDCSEGTFCLGEGLYDTGFCGTP